MSVNIPDQGELRFSVDSSLLFQIGEQLVAKPSIALAELVKNAYDADATRVTVTLENVGQPGGTILIEDDGHGMTLEEVINSWMRIATAAKRNIQTSRIFCRPLTGAKGIGRFAARRLGDKLTLQSISRTRSGETESILVEFDWLNSFPGGGNLVEIPITYTKQAVPSDTSTGVSILIGQARDAWTVDEINELRRDLLSLQTPFPEMIIRSETMGGGDCVPDPGFDFRLAVAGEEELESLSGGLAEAFASTAWAILDGEVMNDGGARYSIRILSTDETDNLGDDRNDYQSLEQARFRIYYYVYRKEYFLETGFSAQDLRSKGRAEGGIRIYLDGFRVFPYGDPGDDWLQLDEYANRNVDLARAISPPPQVVEMASSFKKERPYLLIPKNYQLFGVVAISQSQHRSIQTNVSRERLIDSPTVGQLRRFVQNGIYWMTMKYAAATAEARGERRKKRSQTVPDIIREAKDTLATIAINEPTPVTKPAQRLLPESQRPLAVQEVIKTIDKKLDEAIEQATVEADEHISELSMLRLLASAGTTLTLMNHQLQALIGAVSQTEQDLRRLRPQIPDALYSSYDDITAQVAEWHEMVKLQISQLGFLLSPDSRQRRRRHALYELVENVRKPMSYYMAKYGVQFENRVPRDLRTPPIYQAELYSVLISIFSNALKAVYGQSTRKIGVEANKDNKVLQFRMMDTGVGLPINRREISFEPFVTTSIPNPVLGVGTGLGLTIVRDILEQYNGTVCFIDIHSPWRTCIEISLPDRGVSDD